MLRRCSRQVLGTLYVCLLAVAAGAAEYNVHDYGARGNGTKPDTSAVQAAIDAAHRAGGGVVIVPPGRYPIARIELKSHVTLRLDKDAVLLGSTERQDYQGGPAVVLSAIDAQEIAVEGDGAIDGQTTADYGARWGAPTKPAFRTSLVRCETCRDVTFRGVTLRNSDSWTLHLRRCEHVWIDGITIRDNYQRLNTDGIDPNSCKDVKIRRCHIVCGDDAIVLKSTEPRPCEDIEVSDCVLESATAGLKIGTESQGDFRHIRFRNCRIVNTPVGVGVFVKDGAVVQDVVCENLVMDLCPPIHHAVVPLFIDIEKRHADSRIGVVKDVVFRDIQITGGAGLLLQGMPESRLEDMTLKNITLDVKEAQDYAKRSKPVGGTRTTRDARDTLYARATTWAALANMKNLNVDGFRVNLGPEEAHRFPRSAMALFHVEGGRVSNVTRTPTVSTPRAVEMTDCPQVRIEPSPVR